MSQLSLDTVDTAAPPAESGLSQWFTPPRLAKRIVEWAGVAPGTRVLEPSCGNGRIVQPILDAGARLIACEIDPRQWMATCRIVVRSTGTHEVMRRDFLTAAPRPVDLAILNPPYEGGLDVAFLLRSLEWAPRVVALVRLTTFAGVQRHEQLWRYVRLQRIAFLSRRPDFGGEHGAKTDFCVIDLSRRAWVRPADEIDEPTVEWW